MDDEVRSIRTWMQDQTWHHEEIKRVNNRVLRVKIKRNAYDFQSIATVELWTDNGWTTVSRLAGAEMASCRSRDNGRGVAVAVISYVAKQLDDEGRELIQEDVDRLMDDALFILKTS